MKRRQRTIERFFLDSASKNAAVSDLYVGHSTFSGAASVVLTSLYGNDFAYDSQSDGHLAAEQRPLDLSQIVTRHFASFNQAAEEAGLSRIYGGIHFNFDDTSGRHLGNQVVIKSARLC